MSRHLLFTKSCFFAARATAAKTLLVLLISFAFGTRSNAVQCTEIDFDDSFESASQVVVGQFQTAQLVPGSTSTYMLHFSVLDVLKGLALETVALKLDQERYLDPHAYAAGGKFLMFLEIDQKEIHVCEKIVLIEGGAKRWVSVLQDQRKAVIAQAIACVNRSPNTFQSVGGAALDFDAAHATGLDRATKRWLVSIPEGSPTTLPHGVDLFVDAETGVCAPAPMD